MKVHGFTRERRIRRHREFQAAYAGGTRFFSAHFLLFVLKEDGAPQRVGIAASRRIGNAVARNRVKRLLREFFRTLNFSLPGLQLVAVARKGAPDLGLAAVAAELEPHLRRLARSGLEKRCRA